MSPPPVAAQSRQGWSPSEQARVVNAVVAALLLSTIGFGLSALPVAYTLIKGWEHWQRRSLTAAWCLLGFLALNVLLAPWTTDWRTHVLGLAGTYGLWIAFWRVISGTRWPSPLQARLQWGLIVAGCLHALIGIANSLGARFALQWGSLPWAPGSHLLDLILTTDFQRASGLSMNPNVLAALLLLIWPMTLKQAADETVPSRRWAWIAALLLQWVGLLLSESRGAVVASIALTLTWLVRDKAIRRPLLRAVSVLAALLIVSLPAWRPLVDRLETIQNPDHHSNSIRISLVRSGLEMVREHPLAGLGIGTWREQYPRYQYPEDTANCPHLHNWYLQVASESGLPAAALFFTAIGLIGWQARRRGHPAAEITLGFGLFSVTDYLFHDARVALVAWTIWGLASLPEPEPQAVPEGGPNA